MSLTSKGLPGVACMMRNVNAAIAKMVGMNQKIRFMANLSMRGEASSREFLPIARATSRQAPRQPGAIRIQRMP